MPKLTQNLVINRCPHCAVANPNLFTQHNLATKDHAGGNSRAWVIYVCGGCGGVVTASAPDSGAEVLMWTPHCQQQNVS